jgi:hypothetical protein
MRKLTLILFLVSSFNFAQSNDFSFAKDKQMHTLAGGFCAASGYGLTYSYTKDRKKAKFWGIVTPLVVGTLKELSDRKTTGFDVADLTYSVVSGIAVTYTIDFYVSRNLKRKKR